MLKTWAHLAAICLALVVAGSKPAHAQSDLNIGELVRETQQTIAAANRLSIAWWMPTEFWRLSLQMGKAPKERIEEVEKVLSPVVMVGIIDGSGGPLGGLIFRTEATVRGTTQLRDASGQDHKPIEPVALDPSLQSIASTLRPALANMMGRMGENMQILFFPALSAGGRRIADPNAEGTFKVIVDDREFTFRTPLGSLLPRRRDPVTNETFPGNFRFNPYTGAPLSDSRPATEPPGK